MLRVPILMPQLGESIAEATVVHVLVSVGDAVSLGDDLFEVETNKAMMTVGAPCSGIVTDLLAEEGVSYTVNSPLASLEATEEEAARAGVFPEAPHTQEEPLPNLVQEANLHFAPQEEDQITYPSQLGRKEVRPLVDGLPVPAQASGAAYLSPRLRARMLELGLSAADLSGIAGSGVAGRVTVADFEKFVSHLETFRTSMASPMRVAVADSMRRSCTRPLATVGAPVLLDQLLKHRKASPDPKPGLALYLVRALGIALAENTAPAGRLVGRRIIHPKSIDIGVAVEVEDGVMVPVLRNADQRSLQDMIEEYNELIVLARERRLPAESMGGGIVTITNFGTFGIVWATPIPLPEQNLVFGIGKGLKQPRWDEANQQFLPVTEAETTLSFDHRILDGGAAGRLLARVHDLLQTPEIL